jgi:hypothetical protein
MITGKRLILLALAVAGIAVLVSAGSEATLAQQGGPPASRGGYAITLVLDDRSFEGFSEVGGIVSEIEVLELRE